jgi:preflagellin peptidase FlaK
MFPMYPHFFGLPLISIPPDPFPQVFVSSISILFVAALMVLPIVLFFVVKNAKSGSYSKKMFSSYRVDISKAENSDVWPLEDVVDGKVVSIRIPNAEDAADIYSRLREAGCEDVRITPMIPFVIFIAAAVAFVMLIGSLLFIAF